MLPSLAVTVPGRRLSQPIPTMERRDRSSLGRLVMPAPDTSESAAERRSAAQPKSKQVKIDASDETRASDKQPSVHQPTASSSAAVPQPAASHWMSKVALGVKPAVVKRISNSRKAQLALRRRRMDHNVKLVLSEPCGTK